MAISLKNVNDRLTMVENRSYGHLFPDYSKATKLANSYSGYKPPSNGFMSFDLFNDKAGLIYLDINSTRFYQGYDQNSIDAHINTLIPVTTNDTLSWTYPGEHYSNGKGVYFIPAKTLYYKVLEQIKYLFKEVLS